MRAPVYWYGIITAIAFGAGSFFAYIGGLVGDRFDRTIPLMASTGFPIRCGSVGDAVHRFFRTPPRRALLVNVTPPQDRRLAFGVLRALDIAAA